MNCLVRNLAASSSSSPSEATETSTFGVELVEALGIVRGSSSASQPHEPLEQAATAQAPGLQDPISLSNAEYKDLGDALASILFASSPRPPPNQLSEAAMSDSQPSVEDDLSCSSAQSSLTSLPTDDPRSPAAAAHGKSPASSDSEEESSAGKQKTIKLPQRKGGMQLWQFLYALLSDPQHKDLIEWTDNVKEREFRLHEPEAVAIWWGDHKNKRNMSYDKLSRSLRYYYDKGIIRKINGQRYVYRFCVAPEVMYRHIGNSDCRPKLKPMSIAAQNALSTAANYQNMPYLQPVQPQPLPLALFNPPFVPPLYPPHTTTYPPFSPPTTLVQSHNYLPPAPLICSGSPPNNRGFPQPTTSQSYTPELTNFNPHLLSNQQPPQFSPDYPSCYPVEEAQFMPQFLSEGSPSPQPISPPSVPPSFTNHSPLSPPPPYGWNFSLS